MKTGTYTVKDTKQKALMPRIKMALACTVLILVLACQTAVPAQAAVRAGQGGRAAELIDESRLSVRPADTSAARWVKKGSRLRLKGSNGKYKTGFVKYKGKYYYFDSKGYLKTGWITIGGKKWYASYVKGAKGKGQILTGLVWVQGKTYFMNPGSSPAPGAVSTGFQKISGRRYYFNKNGHLVTGWITVGGNKYYASCNKKGHYGALLTGRQKIGNKTYQFDSSGKLLRTLPTQPARTLTNFAVINQHPELPTGCEATALTMVLNYYGFGADKLDIADNYLPKGPVGSTDFRVAFVGNPRSGSSYGCYAPVIVKTANRYLTAKNSKMRASDISGRELTSLSSYTNANRPVMVWGTINCLAPYRGKTWTVNGKKITWISQEHCLVLLGFQNGNVKVADPYSGTIRLYDLDLFRSRYNALYKQAVILK